MERPLRPGLRYRQRELSDGAGLLEYHGPLDDILKLPYVAGPAVRKERAEGLFRKGLHGLAETAAVLFNEVRGKSGYVAGTAAKRRKLYLDDIEPVLQVVPERA